jgi:hypothetical protein
VTRPAVEFDWRLVGDVGFGEGKPEFPALPTTPGVYRLTFHTPVGAPRACTSARPTTCAAEGGTTGILARGSALACA